jgi:hypothetical protein
MNPQHLVGKRIASIQQHKVFAPEIGTETDTLQVLVLDDGTVLRPVTFAREDGGIGIDFAVERPKSSPGEVGHPCPIPFLVPSLNPERKSHE